MMFYNEYLELAHNNDVRNVRSRNLQARIAHDAFGLTDREFIKTYRLNKHLTMSLIEKIRQRLPSTCRTDGIDPETKVLVTLAFYASGSYQTIVGQSRCHSISQPSMCRAIQQVTEAINQVCLEYVKFPKNPQEREDVKRGFYRKFGMPGVLGSIDGTHVAIVPPPIHEERFFNRKGYHSLNVLLICDSDARILCVDPSNPGSTHDSSAWKNNPLKQKMTALISAGEDFYLLGDSGYPLRRSMMTPILNTTPNSPEAYYTERHMTARNVIERCIGILKARFRCLLVDRKLHYKPMEAAKIINACCVIHNIALQCYHYDDDSGEIQTLLQRENEERARDAQIDLARLRQAEHRARGNEELREGREYQQTLVQQLWFQRQ